MTRLLVPRECFKTLCATEVVTLRQSEVFAYHFSDQLRKTDLRYPAQFFLGFGRITQQSLNFGRTEIARIDTYDCLANQCLLILGGISKCDHNGDFIDAIAFP